MANINWRRIIKRKLFIILAVVIVFSYGNVWAELVAPPSITSFTPTQGGTDIAVTITGTVFTDATIVQFGGTDAASFVEDSATQITAVVGSGSTGVVTVTTGGGTGTSSQTFTFTSTSIPTLNEWGIILFMGLILLAYIVMNRKQARTQ